MLARRATPLDAEMRTTKPNHGATLDAGIALCYKSDVLGPARVSAGR